MSRADYAHWNEEADQIWWAEEGRHVEDEPYDDDSWRDEPAEENEVEHDTEAECLADGNFSRPSRTGVWECDGCGAQYPQYGDWPPSAVEDSHVRSEQSSGQ